MIGLALLLIFLLDATHVVPFSFVQQLELIAYDMRTLLTMPEKPFSGVVVVDIDENSLEQEGRWPWNRDKLAMLVKRLVDEYHVAAVGFDVIFAEPDESAGLPVLDALASGPLKQDAAFRSALDRLRPQLDRDALFRDSLRDRPVILGYYFTSATSNEGAHIAGQLPPPYAARNTVASANAFLNATGYGANLPILQTAAAGAGHFNPFIDPDGKIRRVPMFIEYAGNLYPSLSLSLVRQMLGNPPLELIAPQNTPGNYRAIESVQFGGLTIPVDERACALVPYRGKARTFQYISASDVLHKRASAALLQDSIVLVGTTAIGLMDMRSTPVSNVYPGVEIHANLIAGMLEQSIRHRPAYVMGIEVVVLLLTGLLLIALLPRLDPVKGSLLTLALLALLIGGNLWFWQSQHLVIALAPALFLVTLLYVFYMAYGFIVEARAKKEISSLFGQYVPPELVKEMSNNPQYVSLKSENREMTVLFSDIRDFTSISEGLTPDELSRLLNIYLSRMTEIIHQHRGTVDKYIGDAIMAFWGAPLDDPQHAEHAVAAALEMQQAMTALRAEFAKHGWPVLQIGIGVNTGMMSVGNMGSSFRKAYTVMGDAVNLASRLESLTKFYGVDILLGEDTAHAVPALSCQEIDRVRVKGKGQAVTIFAPRVKNAADLADEEQDHVRFVAMLQHYRLREWDSAEAILRDLLQRSPDCRLYQVYLERIGRYRLTPPEENWQGTFEFRMK